MESLVFAGLLQKCPVEFIRLVESGVNAPTMNVNRCYPTPAYPLTAARFPDFALARFGFPGDNGSPNLSLNRSDTEQ